VGVFVGVGVGVVTAGVVTAGVVTAGVGADVGLTVVLFVF
jgi:hypothetical protein